MEQYQTDANKAFDDWSKGKGPEYVSKVLSELQHYNVKHTDSGYNDAQLNIMYVENKLKRCMRIK